MVGLFCITGEAMLMSSSNTLIALRRHELGLAGWHHREALWSASDVQQIGGSQMCETQVRGGNPFQRAGAVSLRPSADAF
jgi:hypothetical protein